MQTNPIVLIDSLVQDCSNSIANALESLQSCTKPSKSGIGPTLPGSKGYEALSELSGFHIVAFKPIMNELLAN